eukprot:TRINITY_DN15021_c3_g1_i1.p1 TRINITY_DN15021_c3_g1~~TRINITY_DN15021_c3_g1_i1.p1  ORF type:complete len:586 (+),score=125.71 TRINITY_DN15021_c3_g1_i1:55-1758(+)
MGCGASSEDQDCNKPSQQADEKKHVAEDPEEKGEILEEVASTGPATGEAEALTKRKSNVEGDCEGPDESQIDIRERQVTMISQGPKKKGIYIRPSSRCKIQLIFSCKGGENCNIEMKEYDSPDDIRKEWNATGETIPGVYYIRPLNNHSCVASVAPGRFMYRWNNGGYRTTAPGEELLMCEKLYEYHKIGSSFADAAIAILDKLPDDLRSRSPYLQDGGIEKLVSDLDQLETCKSARYLPNDLHAFKSFLVELEDILIYNLFQVSLRIDSQVGYFHKKDHVTSLKEKAQMLLLDKAVAEDALNTALELGKSQVKSALDVGLEKTFSAFGLNQEELLPTLDDKMVAAVDTIAIDSWGLTSGLSGTGITESHSDMLEKLAWDRDPREVKKRAEDTYYSSIENSDPLVPVLCPQSFYHVDLYIVFPTGTENTFTRAMCTLWEEGDQENPLRVVMKEYWIGEGADDREMNSNDESDAGEWGGEDASDDGEDEESDDEEDADEDTTPHWKGFYCTIPVRMDVVYCYRMSIDNKAYLTPSLTKKKATNYYKKFKVTPSLGKWTINALDTLGLV